MNNINEIVEVQRDFYYKDKTKDIQFRINSLQKLKKAIIENEKNIMAALKLDLNKPEFEAYATEIGVVLEEISYTLKHLRDWAKPKKVKTPIMHFIARSYIYQQPYGVVLIMSPWNYPFQLAISPLVGAIAAGNCSVIKPSNYSPNTSAIIEKIINENFDKSYITVLRGGREVNKNLLSEKFDYIFFTGSVEVGKVVMESASKYLTPVSLELGGKSPCIIDETADIDLAAKRIVWGKFTNAGQTCVAPDYILVKKCVKEDLLQKMKKYINQFYGDDPCNNTDYPKIINEKHFNRLVNLLNCGEVVIGGKYNSQTQQIAPTILNNITWDNLIMQDEIFGPIMPVLEFDTIDEIINTINSRAKPLALYYFTKNKTNEHNILKRVSFGGGCINETIVHLATSHMPFGGVGESGMGGYHGKSSFDTFTHKKSILKKSNLIDIAIKYPPYDKDYNVLKKFMR